MVYTINQIKNVNDELDFTSDIRKIIFNVRDSELGPGIKKRLTKCHVWSNWECYDLIHITNLSDSDILKMLPDVEHIDYNALN